MRKNSAAYTATTWPEALQKQADLMAAEAYDDDDPGSIGAYFARGELACKSALEIWREEEQKVASEISNLQRKIDLMRVCLRVAVANRLDEEMPDNCSVATAMREVPETKEDLSEWLSW